MSLMPPIFPQNFFFWHCIRQVFVSFFLPLRWDRMARVTWSWLFPFPRPVRSANTQQVRLQLTGFPWGKVLLGRPKCSGKFQKQFIYPSSHQKHKGFFSHICCECLVEPGGKCGVLPTGSPAVFNSVLSTLRLQQFPSYSLGFPPWH